MSLVAESRCRLYSFSLLLFDYDYDGVVAGINASQDARLTPFQFNSIQF